MEDKKLTREKVNRLIELIKKDKSLIETIKPELADAVFGFLTEKETWALFAECPDIIYAVSPEKLAEFRTMANPYQEPVQTGDEDKFMCFSFINLQEKYQKRLAMTSLVAFIYRMLSEHNIQETFLPVYSFVESFKPTLPEHCPKGYMVDPENPVEPDVIKNALVEETEEQEVERLKYEEDIKLYQQIKERYDDSEQFTYKEMMYEFLNEYLDFNPDKHVRSATYSCEEDTTRQALEELKGKTPEEIAEAVNKLPPMDTYRRWKRYENANYEALRSITNDIYGEKPYLDACFMPYGVGFKTVDEAKSFVRKYKREFGVEVHIAKAWNWSFLEAWRENREKVMLDDEKLAILKSIVENQQEEEKLARDMLKKRVENEKKKNIRKAGPDDPGLGKYLKEFAPPISKEGVSRVLEAREIGDLESLDKECPDDAVEVNVVEIKNQAPDHLGKGGGVEVKTGKFFTAAEDPKSMNVIHPGEDPQKSELKDKTIAKAFGGDADAGTFDL